MTYDKDAELGRLIRDYNAVIEEMGVLRQSIRSMGRNASFITTSMERGELNMLRYDPETGIISAQAAHFDWADLVEKLVRWRELKDDKDMKDDCLKSAGLMHLIRHA